MKRKALIISLAKEYMTNIYRKTLEIFVRNYLSGLISFGYKNMR